MSFGTRCTPSLVLYREDFVAQLSSYQCALINGVFSASVEVPDKNVPTIHLRDGAATLVLEATDGPDWKCKKHERFTSPYFEAERGACKCLCNCATLKFTLKTPQHSLMHRDKWTIFPNWDKCNFLVRTPKNGELLGLEWGNSDTSGKQHNFSWSKFRCWMSIFQSWDKRWRFT